MTESSDWNLRNSNVNMPNRHRQLIVTISLAAVAISVFAYSQQRPRRPSPSGNTSQSSLSLTNNSHQNSFGGRLRNRLASFSSADASNGGSISSSYGDEEDLLGGTVEEIELQPMIIDGGSSSANMKRRGNARSQQIHQHQPAPSSQSHRINSKKENDPYNIQTV